MPAIEGPFWIILGFLLGQRGLGFFPPDILGDLEPVVLLGLAWIGLVFGMQVDFRILRKMDARQLRLGLLFPIGVGAVVAAVFLLVGFSPFVALALGAVSMLSTPETLDALARSRKPRRRMVLRFLRLVMAFSGIPAVAVFGIASILYSPFSTLSGGIASPAILLLSIAGIGLVAGYALLIMSRGRRDMITIITLLMGITAMVAGAASVLGVSPLPAAAVTGAVVINRCVFPHRILKATHLFERPLLVALLVLVGSAVRALDFSWPIFLGLVLVRGATLLVGGRYLAGILTRRGWSPLESGLGLGFFPQGALALGLVVALLGVSGPEPGALEAMALAMVVNQVFGDFWYRKRLFEPGTAGRKP